MKLESFRRRFFELLSRYEWTGTLGHGGIGVVFKAFDRELEETVAIKVLSPNLGRDENALLARFKREFRTLHVDVGRSRRNRDIVEKYGNPIDMGIPSVVLLAPDGTLLYTDHGSLSSAGRMSDPELIAFFERLAAGYPVP